MLRNKKFKREIPIESHETAPLSNIEKTKISSNVSIPAEADISDAKGWVDENEK